MKNNKCITKWCRNKKQKGRRVCAKCKARKWRALYPIKYAYYTLKYNARRRGKHFDLSIEEFSEFVYRTGYVELKGKTRFSMSIDRIDNSLGYTKENIQMITLSDNTRKQHTYDAPF